MNKEAIVGKLRQLGANGDPLCSAAIDLIESLARDAERYRWLRDESPKHTVQGPTASYQNGYGIKVVYQSYAIADAAKPHCVLFENGLDAAIDAMTEPQKGE